MQKLEIGSKITSKQPSSDKNEHRATDSQQSFLPEETENHLCSITLHNSYCGQQINSQRQLRVTAVIVKLIAQCKTEFSKTSFVHASMPGCELVTTKSDEVQVAQNHVKL